MLELITTDRNCSNKRLSDAAVIPARTSSNAFAVAGQWRGSAPASPAAHRIHQIEFKNSRHIFIWGDIPALATKDYIQSQYQSYLDAANAKYAQLKADKERR